MSIVAVPVVRVQNSGWMAYMARAKTVAQEIDAYARLKTHILFWKWVPASKTPGKQPLRPVLETVSYPTRGEWRAFTGKPS